MNDIREYLKDHYLVFDGAMGSLLQQGGMKLDENPIELNITKPNLIEDIHFNYLNSGANVILTNTFSANPIKYEEINYSLDDIIQMAVSNANNAVKRVNKKAFVAYDIGPLGELLEPSGTLSFEKAYDAFTRIVRIANKLDIDLFVVETISDLYEAKAAILAIKENSNKPIFVSHTFENNHKTLVGNDIISIVATLEGLNVDALGLNCGFGPQDMLPLVKEFIKYSSLPIMVQPNAGLPNLDGSYNVKAEDFIIYMKEIINEGATIVGGCCGTNYDFIKLIASYIKDKKPILPNKKNLTITSSGTKGVIFDNNFIKIGERINPTGKEHLKQALLNNDDTPIIKEALAQEEEKANVLDINVGLPNFDEENKLPQIIKKVQEYVNVPLQIDTTKEKALAKALRIYNGKPIINSVNGKEESLNTILPLAKKYGALIIGLCIDEKGLALSVDDKLRVARKILNKVLEYGIDKENLIIDPLTLTASAQQEDVKATLEAIYLIKKELGLKTILGLSNVSFGLPNRPLLNSTFLSLALSKGLDSAILNTASLEVMNTIYAYEVLFNIDKQANNYLSYFNVYQDKKLKIVKDNNYSLKEIIIKGLKDEAIDKTRKELKIRKPLDIIENDIVKSLDEVGKRFEEKQLYLPQLIQSAQTVTNIFDVIKKEFKDNTVESKGIIVLATVKGDVHDIGKNIVKVILANYGYKIIDLGKDVSSEEIIRVLNKNNVKLVGLSALMTTTVASMKDIIKDINNYDSNIKIMVGGAVLNKKYAQEINADYYCKDALAGVDVAKEVYRN
ncbi:MAG: homocysteine S-methyltransferase family protein [Bacilli bacterium]|jgi:5-methyltetrahydrofolate--homocysteine methyltransferase|nr:homocysteine S-methyltransferase family protein [Bacilli bacterium]